MGGNNMKKLFPAILIIIVVISFKAYALTENTHKAINERIAQRSINGFSFDTHLINQLGFSKGVTEDLWGIDAEGHNKKKKVFEWLGYGGEQEDRPGEWYDYLPFIGKPTRSVNHFHNPLKAWSEAGLNDKILGIISYTGQSQVLWAQNSTQDVGGNWAWQDARRYFYGI
jgi:hypothetical protein